MMECCNIFINGARTSLHKLTEKELQTLSKRLEIPISDILFHTNGGLVHAPGKANIRVGKENGMFGKTHSKETRKKISDKRKAFCNTKEYKSQKSKEYLTSKFKAPGPGYVWWNNGKSNTRSIQNPGKGFVRGRIFSKEHSLKFLKK